MPLIEVRTDSATATTALFRPAIYGLFEPRRREIIKTVWIASWEMQCCGDPFHVGSQVSWSLRASVDLEYLTTVLGDSMASQVTHAYDHHSIEPIPEGQTMTVRSITAVWCRFAKRTDTDRASYPVAGSGVIEGRTSVTRSREKDEGDLYFVAYLVDLGDQR